MGFRKWFSELCDNEDSERGDTTTTHVPPIITFYCPVCQRDVNGKQQLTYDRGYDRRIVICFSCNTNFKGRRHVIIDDPYLVNEEMLSKKVTINGETYFYILAIRGKNDCQSTSGTLLEGHNDSH